MKKRGFTLVELLGVIVVLGILATITTPIIMNAVEKSKKEAVIRSAEQMIKSITLDYTTNDNFTTNKLDVLSLNYNGEKPESGYIQFDEDEKVRLYMIQNGYCVAKTYDTELAAVKLEDTDICDWYTSPNTIREETTESVFALNDLKTGNLLNYKIYGNSYQATRNGKNLFDVNDFIETYSPYFATNPPKITQFEGEEVLELWGGVNATGREIRYMDDAFKENTQYTVSFEYYDVLSPVNNLSGATLMICYTDGSRTYFFSGDRTQNAETWQTVKITTRAGMTVDYIRQSYNTGGGKSYIKNFQIEEGTTATPYEPYGVMPSPDFPSEVQSLGKLVTEEGPNKGKYEIPIRVTGKNVWEYGDLNSINDKGKSFELDLTGTYTFSVALDYEDYTYQSASLLRIVTDEGNFDLIPLHIVQYGKERVSITVTGHITKIIFNNWSQVIGDVINIQLEEGSEATAYEEYKGGNYRIYIDEPLRCASGTCDYIDFETNQVVRRIKMVELDGVNNKVYKNDSTANSYMYYAHFEDSHDHIPGLSTHFAHINTYPSTTEKHGKFNNTLYSNSAIWLNGYDIVSADNATLTAAQGREQFNNWLSSQKNNGNAVNFQYVLLEPIYKEINLPKIEVFDGINNITVTDGNLNASKIEIIGLKK